MLFSGSLERFYYASHKGSESLNPSLFAEFVKGKKVDDDISDVDHEEELDVLAWNPPKKGTKRGLKADENVEKVRTAADDEYEQENNFQNIDAMIKTAQEVLLLESSFQLEERANLESATSNGTESIDFAASGRSVSAYSSKSAVSSVGSANSVAATPASRRDAQKPLTPFTPILKNSISTPASAMNITGISHMNITGVTAMSTFNTTGASAMSTLNQVRCFSTKMHEQLFFCQKQHITKISREFENIFPGEKILVCR